MRKMRNSLWWLPLLACLACGAVAALFPARSVAAQIPILAWTERSDWINVKSDVTPAAVGDGVADDTAAIQAALAKPGNGNTVYFPPGTYKVTSTLTLLGDNSHFALNLMGCGRSTVLSWHGPTNGNFFVINSNPYSRYEGLILDGRGIASNAFYHYNSLKFETSIRYRHMGFYNFVGSAVYAVYGNGSYATAETSYENCIFDHCAYGVRLVGWNLYDHTFAGCDFIACGTGIYCSHGNFYARECYFQGSTAYDIQTSPEHGCSVRRCKSVGSAQFISFNNQVSPLTVQDCYVTGWTGTAGAINHLEVPLVLSHSRFVNPPDTSAPVRCSGKVVLCDNAAPQSPAVATGSNLYFIGSGTYAPRVGTPHGSNIVSFINETVTVPPVVYDAKVSHGVVGDGVADDTVAIQNTINAARMAGGGAIAYLPQGNYKITSTLTMTGGNYVVGGSGYFARLIWAGAAGGTMLSVQAQNNLQLENIMVGHHDPGQMNNGIDIAQTSNSGASTMTYDGVYVYGKYQMQPEKKGLCLNGLGSNSTVVLKFLEGNLRLNDSANATVLGNITYEGAITVDQADSNRTGFLGIMTRLNTINTYGIKVRNNNSIVLSDWYGEQSYNGMVFSGVDGNPPGRITVQSPKIQYTTNTAIYMLVSNYQGRIFVGPSQFYASTDVPTQTIFQTGARAVSIVMFGCPFYNEGLSVTTSSASFHAVANESCVLMNGTNLSVGAAPPDNFTAQTLTDISAAFDDLQRLGTLDLDLNFPFLERNAPPTVSIVSPSDHAVYMPAPATVAITASASDGDGTIGRVAFYQGGEPLGAVTNAPFTFNWTNVPVGSYVLTAKAYDEDGAAATSTAVNIRVKDAATGICLRVL